MPEETLFTQFLKLVPLLSVVATVTGWIVSSRFSSKNTGHHAKNAELNKLIDALNKSLEDMFNEMTDVLSENMDDTKKSITYHKFVGMVMNIRFLCEAIEKIDESQKIDQFKFIELRQACTNERKYDSKKINITLPELQNIQEQIKRSYNKKFAI
ncbi:hypothetical protein [Kluyvera cryocrescens]|uniref:hypothetical protein n=1 Tax=Kluyvera cryocrescens TaxID=580 RepID=UPI0028AA6FC6|nr:hypothetical protein [Kluyvera cryocrescens]